MLKKISCAALAAFMLTAVGCSKKEEGSSIDSSISQEHSEAESSAEEMIPDATVVSNGINPLTGEIGYNESASGKRPVAVMVNNLVAALPQYGIEQADVIYELPVEGGITRLMAIYADYSAVPDVCSVRSCRYYYPLISLGMDAIYCHWGSDQTIALDTLNRTGINHFDGSNESGMFYRDEDRVGWYDSEHTGYLRGSELPAKIAEKGFRTDINSECSGTMFNFVSGDEKVAPSEITANTVTVNFSQSYFSTFEYDAASGQYLKYHSGNPHIDGKTENQLGFENVFVLQTDIHTRDDGYLMDVSLNGGTGYYISCGSAQSITWSKPSENLPIQVYAADGSELTVNIGESYIGIIGNEKIINIE